MVAIVKGVHLARKSGQSDVFFHRGPIFVYPHRNGPIHRVLTLAIATLDRPILPKKWAAKRSSREPAITVAAEILIFGKPIEVDLTLGSLVLRKRCGVDQIDAPNSMLFLTPVCSIES